MNRFLRCPVACPSALSRSRDSAWWSTETSIAVARTVFAFMLQTCSPADGGCQLASALTPDWIDFPDMAVAGGRCPSASPPQPHQHLFSLLLRRGLMTEEGGWS
jgi:hypothetical protein